MPDPSNSNSGHIRNEDSAPLERLLSGLPSPIGRMFAWMRRPETQWVRIPAASVLIIGGLLGFLPILGFWMLPFGALLLAEDFPVLRRPTMRALGTIQAWYDRRRGTARGRP